jgi:4-nitrophenyl phosphatase
LKFSAISGLICDMDGVLWRGDEPLDGLRMLFTWLHEQQIPYMLLTNNSSRTQADYVAKLATMGVEGIRPEQILTSSIATADYMRSRYPAGTRVYALGMGGLRAALEAEGFEVLPSAEAFDSSDPVQVVVSGIDFALTYNQLTTAALHLQYGADFIGTNGDVSFPIPQGESPGAGSILALLKTATGREPVVIGKPAAPMFESALQLMNLPASAVLMLGDRLDTDIKGAQGVGMPTALVLTGVTTADDLIHQQIWADVVYEDLPALVRAWAGDEWFVAWKKAERERAAGQRSEV